MSVCLEGALYKWTNYYLGWQPRWFVLDDGVLSYYLSSNEVSQGSRGSVIVASCNISAHPKDQRRIDIIIRGERYMYLRTSSATERQKWLIALGSAKQEEPGGGAVHSTAVKSKIILLHTNCQLLVSQIATLKSVVADRETLSDASLDGISTKISTSCDEFLNILAECMDLNYEDSQSMINLINDNSCDNRVWPSHIKPLSSKAAGSPHLSLSPQRRKIPSDGFFSRDEPYLSSTQSLGAFPSPTSPPSIPLSVSLPLHLQHPSTNHNKQQEQEQEQNSQKVQADESTAQGQDPVPQSSRSNSELFLTPTASPVNTPPPSPRASPTDTATFFSKLPCKFGSIRLTAEREIPTIDFLDCCRSAVPFFDLLSPTAFSPVKQDINGNIAKIKHKYEMNPERHHTLQSLVLEELTAGTQNARNSATDALLWLKRAMEFIQVFLFEVSNGETSLDIAAGKAYAKSLRQHHNWIVKGIFNLAVKAVPYHNDFLKLLGSDGTVTGNDAVLLDMRQFSLDLKQMIVLLNEFYQSHGLGV